MDATLLIAALAGAVGGIVFGAVWYSPALFGNAWRRLSRLPDDHAPNPAVTYGGAFALLFLAAAVFGAFLGPDPGLGFALGAGLSAGVTWAAGSLWISYLFEGRPLRLGLINGGYHTGQFVLYGLAFALL